MNPTHQELWARCCEFIKDNISAEQYNTWFRDISSVSYADGRLVLEVKSQFFVDQLEERYQQLLRSGIRKVYGENIQLFYRTPTVPGDDATLNIQRSSRQSATILDQRFSPAANPFTEPTKENFDPQLNSHYTFENYCLSDCNRIARTIGESIGDNPSLKTFNPLFVFGPSGVGKTHLIQAIGIRIKERNPRARVLYTTARLFQNQYTAAAAKNINSFFHFYQSVDTLIIDDVQDLQNMPGTQNCFFHIFNHLHLHDRQIIMSSDCAPAQMEGFEARLLNRFKWGMQVELERPDIALRREVLQMKSEQDGIALPAEIAEYIAGNVTQSVRELEGVLVSLIAHATYLNCDISLDLARRVVSNAVRIKRRQINFEMIADAVAAGFNISPDLIFTKNRKREVADARQAVMYLAKKLAGMSMTAIGKKLGRTHATVIHACTAVDDRIQLCKKFASQINAIEADLASR